RAERAVSRVFRVTVTADYTRAVTASCPACGPCPWPPSCARGLAATTLGAVPDARRATACARLASRSGSAPARAGSRRSRPAGDPDDVGRHQVGRPAGTESEVPLVLVDEARLFDCRI